mmetsp:Transcript_39555/g.92417  ORF Transcript_39555/g.92417 Transcript_39555/m.92417 type:complete len:331 (-) Transcript_39555:1190-2182(-)
MPPLLPRPVPHPPRRPPDRKKGSNVVEFCAKYGTNYADITGEVDWSRSMIHRFSADAERTGSKIVSFCGHDSVPWDLTVHKLAQYLRRECGDDELVECTCVNEIQGAVSGGTIETAFLAMSEEKATYDKDPWMRRAGGAASDRRTKMRNAALLSPLSSASDRFAGQWEGPFVMAAVNGDVVRRSNAIASPEGSGRASSVAYREGVANVDLKTAFVNFFGLVFGVVAAFNPLTGALLRKVLPKPGEGPSEEQMDAGYLRVSGYGVGSKGNKVESVFYFPNDPGYRDTGECDLCIPFYDFFSILPSSSILPLVFSDVSRHHRGSSHHFFFWK